MRIWYDTEFLEAGPFAPISLISIGLVREDGAELYRIDANAPWDAIGAHPWLAANVLPHLPARRRTEYEKWVDFRPDYDDPRVMNREHVAADVRAFVTEGLPEGEKAELWAYYADYDHVVLSQLYGRMVDLPAGFPMYTRDLKQVIDQHRLEVKVGSDTDHDALADARGVAKAWTQCREKLFTKHGRDMLGRTDY